MDAVPGGPRRARRAAGPAHGARGAAHHRQPGHAGLPPRKGRQRRDRQARAGDLPGPLGGLRAASVHPDGRATRGTRLALPVLIAALPVSMAALPILIAALPVSMAALPILIAALPILMAALRLDDGPRRSRNQGAQARKFA